MPGQLLLITDDAHFDELRAHSGLPHAWLMEADADSLLDQVRAEEPWILRVPRSMLVPELANPLDDGAHTEFINSLLEATICYLAVVGDAESEANRTAGNGSPGNAWNLAEHLAWYEQLCEELEKRARARHVQLRHVLILVCCQDLPVEELACVQGLSGDDDPQRLFDTCYVMLEELEPGQSGMFFQSANVWPASVGGLLLKLLHDSSIPRSGPARTYAWRSYQIMPDVAEAEFQQATASVFDELFKRIISDKSADPAWDLSRFTKFDVRPTTASTARLERPRDDGFHSQQRWLEYEAAVHLAEIAADNRWEKTLSKAGAEFGRRLSHQVIGEDSAAAIEAIKIWNSVHHDPRFVFAALENPALVRQPPLTEPYDTISRHWQEILEKDEQREREIQNASGCAEELKSAQAGFVNVYYRLTAIAAVSLAVGYFAMLISHALLGTWREPIMIASAGVAGALLAGLFSLDREDRAGRRARQSFEGQLREIDKRVEQRHERCQRAVDLAHVFRQQTHASAAAGRLKLLLERVQRILSREFQRRPESAPGTTATEPASETANGDAGPTRREQQRSRFLAAMRLQHSFSVGPLDAKHAELAQFVQAQADTFRHEVWARFCEHHDRERAGNLPARLLIPAIRRFRTRFRAELITTLCRQSLEQRGQSEGDTWWHELRKILSYQEFFEMMSCRVFGHQTTYVDRPLPRLYLQHGFEFVEMMNFLDSAELLDKPVISPYLSDLAVLGFLYQEMPVRFQSGPRGRIEIAPYHLERDADK